MLYKVQPYVTKVQTVLGKTTLLTLDEYNLYYKSGLSWFLGGNGVGGGWGKDPEGVSRLGWKYLQKIKQKCGIYIKMPKNAGH